MKIVLLITCSPPRTCYEVRILCGIFQSSKSLENIWSALLQKFRLKYWPFKIRILNQNLVKLIPRVFYEFQFSDQILGYPHVFNFLRERITVKKCFRVLRLTCLLLLSTPMSLWDLLNLGSKSWIMAKFCDCRILMCL